MSQNTSGTPSASQSAAVSIPYHPQIPFQQSVALSEDLELLRVGHFVLGESLTPSITQSQITIAPSPIAGYYNGPPIEQSSSTPSYKSISPKTTQAVPDSHLHVPESSLSFNSGAEVPPESSSVSVFSAGPANQLFHGISPSSDVSVSGFTAGLISQPSHSISPLGLPESNLPADLDHQDLSSSQTYTNVDGHLPPNPLASTLARDAVLTYAYRLYQSQRNPGATSILSATPVFNLLPDMTSLEHVYSQLVPLLRTLRTLHPHHLPTLLLLGSVHYAMDDYSTSLSLNEEILAVDPEYVEAMCNIGAIMKKLSLVDQAYNWWWKALQLRPAYWEVTDNVLNLVLEPVSVASDPIHSREDTAPFYLKALEICRYIQSRLVDSDGCLLSMVSPSDFHRFQNIFCTSANLVQLIYGGFPQDAMNDYFTAIELAIRSPSPCIESERYTIRDFVFAVCVAGFSLSSVDDSSPAQILGAFVHAGELAEPGFNILHAIHASGDRLADALFREGSGVLPTILLRPDEVLRLPVSLFPETSGVLPVIYRRVASDTHPGLSNGEIRRQIHLMTSTILLSVAKRIQDGVSGIHAPIGGSLRVSPSLILLLYYLALALSPSPSLYNNVGVILSGLSTVSMRSVHGSRHSLSGQELAKMYYEMGLQLDPAHPHLLTNYGSLLKDQGRTSEAIHIYTQAIRFQPNLDVALANLANAIKDLGRPWDAIVYYRRAVAVNPHLPEATCGLINSLNAVCDWRGRGKVAFETLAIDQDGNIRDDIPNEDASFPGWMTKLVETCERQLISVYSQNVGVVCATRTLNEWLDLVEVVTGSSLSTDQRSRWTAHFAPFYTDFSRQERRVNEGGFVIRFIEWAQRRLQRRWYLETYGRTLASAHLVVSPMSLEDVHPSFMRPTLPPSIATPPVPSVLPFHTFMYPLNPRTIRLISHRNALRVSQVAFTKPWLPRYIYPPPPPPFQGRLNIGYVSSDFNDHPLSHLMQSVFSLHDRTRFNVHVYATSPSDGSSFRQRIETGSDQFFDVSSWPVQSIVERIVMDRIHILINLGGYTRGSRNEIFVVRPSPIQISLMGFAGTLAAGWCDYLVCDIIACPEDLTAEFLVRDETTSYLYDDLDFGPAVGTVIDPEYPTDDWMYTESFIYMPHSFLATDHKQSFRKEENLSAEERTSISAGKLWIDEERRRTTMRQALFPDLPSDVVIFVNFNQLYKIDPDVFATWLRILARVPRGILWLLRFPAAGEEHLIRTAKAWAGDEIASRIHFTDVASKEDHIQRCRVADLFLDTTECNAHTIASDVLWSGTPILTWPKHRYKMCSRVAASVAHATGFGSEMVVSSLQDYEERAISWANEFLHEHSETPGLAGSRKNDENTLIRLRRNLYLNRDQMPLFDTQRWTRNIEKGYEAAWARWVEGSAGGNHRSGCIFVHDDDPIDVQLYD